MALRWYSDSALRWAAFGSAGLLFLFGSAMAISFGIKSPFDYSVFAAMCCALFLGLAGSNSMDRQLVNRRDSQTGSGKSGWSFSLPNPRNRRGVERGTRKPLMSDGAKHR